PSVLQQTITQEWMANEKAREKYDSYRQFGVSRAEFEKIIEFGIHSRKVLVKQAGGAVVVKMDLGGKMKYCYRCFRQVRKISLWPGKYVNRWGVMILMYG
ncbi:hypothetical protein MJM09_23565, partial [Salmonella enterica subsp. enterica serovar Kentucky]|nr:hypothetical protein [Salmonella enterica subsp. enterica serovar Kentucky]